MIRLIAIFVMKQMVKKVEQRKKSSGNMIIIRNFKSTILLLESNCK